MHAEHHKKPHSGLRTIPGFPPQLIDPQPIVAALARPQTNCGFCGERRRRSELCESVPIRSDSRDWFEHDLTSRNARTGGAESIDIIVHISLLTNSRTTLLSPTTALQSVGKLSTHSRCLDLSVQWFSSIFEKE